MGPREGASGSYEYYSLKLKYNNKKDACVVNNKTGERISSAFDGRILAMNPDSYQYEGETKHKWVWTLDVSATGDASKIAKLEMNFSIPCIGLINNIAKACEDMKGLIVGSIWSFEMYMNKSGYANAALKINNEKESPGWLYEWSKIENIKDNPQRWIDLWEKHIKPYIPSDYKADESALAGVAESKNGPVEDDDSSDLPF